MTLATSEGLTVAAAAVGFPGLVATGEVSPPLNVFDTEATTAENSPARRDRTAVAPVRWLPRSTAIINYARGEFTEDEREAFHRAIGLWQQALSELKLGISLEERGEIDKDTRPAPSQIIIKRDYTMDSRHYGKIVAGTRPDNYLDRAFILIQGSLRKRSSLRKTMLHELGHAFGLRDCPDCRSGVTVMNYFSQQSVMGFKIRNGGGKISDKPTVGDISQVASGYQSSLPVATSNETAEWQSSRILVADETVGVPSGNRSDTDSNIIAPYLTPKAATEIHGLANTSYFKPTVAPKIYELALGSYLKPAAGQKGFVFRFAPRLKPLKPLEPMPDKNSWFAFPPFAKLAAVAETSTLPTAFYPNSTSAPGPNKLVIAPHIKLAAAAEANPFAAFKATPAAAAKKLAFNPYRNPERGGEANSLGIANLKPASPPETNAAAVASGARKQSLLTDAEKTEFESFIPILLGKENETMVELNNYIFRRDLVIQTIDKKGRVSGEYHRVSDMVFDDSGGRVERGLWFSESKLERLKISPEFVEDFSGVQLKGFELSKRDHYRIEPFMEETIDGVRMRVYRMTPLNLNAERAAQTRVFYGYVWVDEKTGNIVKISGCALPDDKQRFPLFETKRALIDGTHLFPVHTIADDQLVFSSHKVHVRMLITYSNYKRFASRVNVIEVDGN